MLGGGKDELSVPDVLLADGGLWSQTRAPQGSSFEDSRDRFRREVSNAVQRKDDGNALEDLTVPAQALFYNVISPDLEQALRTAREAAAHEPPVLTVHLYPRDEWIPWELLNDGSDFLGLQFRIARMPILGSPAHRPVETTHRLEIVRSMLGNKVAARDGDDYKSWRDTFDELLPEGAQAAWIPSPQQEAAPWPTIGDLRQETDILHITCHGQAEPNKPPVWKLDPDSDRADRYDFDRGLVDSLRRNFARRAPLVFANACSQEPTGLPPKQPPLASEMVAVGAANFVGTLAPIRPKVAMRLARNFFDALLREGKDVSTALLTAKQRCRADADIATDPTYLMYCLYGPATTRFVAGDGAG